MTCDLRDPDGQAIVRDFVRNGYTVVLASVAHAILGKVKMPAVVPRLSESPGGITWLGRDLGADTDAVLTGTLGYTPAQLDQLRGRGII